MLAAGNALLHCHIAAPGNRRYLLPDDGVDYTAFFGALRAIGYTGRVSVEGTGAPQEYAATLERLKSEAL
jgi:sugar phosphate isomerase/epimerase